MPKVVAFVPAKGNSERIKNKNLAVLDGEHLFKRKLRMLLECPLIDEIILDTESQYLIDLASDLPIRNILRPADLATNKTDGHELFAWECSQVEADIYIQTLCTAPFVDAATLTRALTTLQENPEHNSLIGVSKTKQYLWEKGNPLYGWDRIPNSIDLPDTCVEGMSLYIVRNTGAAICRRFTENPLFFSLTPRENIDVNFPEDLEFAEIIAAGERAQQNLQLKALEPYLSSSMISDITREMGLTLTLPSEIRGNRPFLGKAKTLLLDRPNEEESWRGIYDALDSYQFIRPGDVIVVKNNVPDCAYFGNLNAQLARRAGAIGAVIDGVTRDKSEVDRLGFPVYARGHYCVDIKFAGTTRAMNKPVEIGGIRIENNDYIFADPDGVTVIPQGIWKDVYQKLLQGIEKEWRVGMSVALGAAPKDIFNTLGEF